jgi:hypothetical protein
MKLKKTQKKTEQTKIIKFKIYKNKNKNNKSFLYPL